MIKVLPPDASIGKMETLATELAAANPSLDASEAQQRTARQYGFASWRQLVAHLLRNREGEDGGHPDNQDPPFLRLACLNYCGFDRPQNWERAEAMLAADPGIASRDIHHAAAVGNVEAVERFLDEDADCVNRRGGYFDWEPLLYACYSRLNLPDHSTSQAARLLLDRGADPNAHYMWGGQYRFTALTGVFGEGENGPKNCPEHQDCDSLARRLLEAGADPNDGQALYDRMFTDGHRCLELLLKFGLKGTDRCNWLMCENGELRENPETILRYQLDWAISNHHDERARLLIDRGADLATEDGEQSLYELAMLTGNEALAAYLVKAGADPVALSPLLEFASACMAANREKAESLLAADDSLMRQLQQAQPNLLGDAAGADRRDAVRLMAELGADLNRLPRAPLHEAAWSGHVEMVKLLVDHGADVRRRDPEHCATALLWAKYNGKQPVIDYLATCEIDIFDALACGNLERVRAILASDPSQLETTLGDARNGDNVEPYDWKTPLASAITRENQEAVQLLLEHGADFRVTDSEGGTLLALAEADSTPEIAALLRQYLEASD